MHISPIQTKAFLAATLTDKDIERRDMDSILDAIISLTTVLLDEFDCAEDAAREARLRIAPDAGPLALLVTIERRDPEFADCTFEHDQPYDTIQDALDRIVDRWVASGFD